jgi:hypothetical protein
MIRPFEDGMDPNSSWKRNIQALTLLISRVSDFSRFFLGSLGME